MEHRCRAIAVFAGASSICRSRCSTWNPSSRHSLAAIRCKGSYARLFHVELTSLAYSTNGQLQRATFSRSELFGVCRQRRSTWNVPRPISHPDLSESDPGSVGVSRDRRVPRGTHLDTAWLLSVRLRRGRGTLAVFARPLAPRGQSNSSRMVRLCGISIRKKWSGFL